MDRDQTEQILSGGVNQVRRIGATVIRSTGPHSPSVHRLLFHLQRKAFSGSPRVVDVDIESGTETLSYLPGEVSGYPLVEAFRTDRVLLSAAELLRDYHDATVDFEIVADDRWYTPARQPAEVICHGDYAPYNCAVAGRQVTGLFDFDTAHPGPRLWDIGYGAYRWAPLTGPHNHDGFGDVAEQGRRLRLFCDRYGTPNRLAVVDAAVERLRALVEMMRRLADDGHQSFARHIQEGHDRLYLSDIAYLNEHRISLAGHR